MQEEGFIAKLLYPEGSKDVELGKVVAIIVENKEDVAKFSNYTGAAPAPAKKEQTPEEKRSCPVQRERPTSEADQSLSGSVSRVKASPLAQNVAD